MDDPSTLLRELDRLDVAWNLFEVWLSVCTGFVLLGVALELKVVWMEWRSEKRDFLIGTIHSPEKPQRAKYIWEVAGIVFVAVGVLGELILGIVAGGIETKMRNDTKSLVAIIDGKAASANERAATLEKEAAQLRSDNLILQKSILGLQKDAQWRHIPPDKLPKLIKLLSAGPKGVLRIDCVGASEDACPLAREIWRVLIDSGWPQLKDGNVNTSFGADSSQGMGILVKDIKACPPFAKHLQDAFGAIGMDFPGFSVPSMDTADVTLKIGRKSEPKLEPINQNKAQK